jgi:H+/gluconate symporter-like permease
MGYAALLISLTALVILSYRRVSPLIVGPVVSLLLALMTGLNPGQAILGPYMETVGSYFIRFFLVFLTGSIYGAVMHKTGAAAAIAEKIIRVLGVQRVILGVMIATAVLTYGGVSLFVIIFVMYPLALPMFAKADLPKRLIPGAVALGAFTFTMTTPGSPQVQNIIPTSYLGTGPMSGVVPGWTAGLFIAVAGVLYLQWVAVRQRRLGGRFDAHAELEELSESLPGFWASITPSLLIVVLLNGFDINIVWAMMAGILLSVALLWRRIESPSGWLQTVNVGASNSTLVMLNTAAIVGYAGIVRLIPQFPEIIDSIKSISVSPYYFPAVTTTLLAGLAGSASGGLSVAYEALTPSFLNLGISTEDVHRISAMAAGGLDSLPHCGAVITLLAVCKTTHADSYTNIFVVTVLIPLLAVFLILVPLSILL